MLLVIILGRKLKRSYSIMGMFNEVKCRCPHCGTVNILQVSQYELGFGDFDIQDPETFRELEEHSLRDLLMEIEEESFYCESCETYYDAELSSLVHIYKDANKKSIRDYFEE
jgi:phage terminase large subunit GpA-like protein